MRKPSDICITLAAVKIDEDWLSADEIAHRLNRLGFEVTTQQAAAYLKRLSRMEAPPIEIRDARWSDGIREYRCTVYGRTWLGNLIPWARRWS